MNLFKVLLSVGALRVVKERFGSERFYVDLLECRGKKEFLGVLRKNLGFGVGVCERVWFVLWSRFPFCVERVDRSNVFSSSEARLFHELLCLGGVASFFECRRVVGRRRVAGVVESLEDFGFVVVLRFADGGRFVLLGDGLVKEFAGVKE